MVTYAGLRGARGWLTEDITICYRRAGMATPVKLNRKHRATLASIFGQPVRSDIRWADIEALMLALGGTVSQRSGSRVAFRLGDNLASFHSPHPRPVTDKGAVVAVRRFLQNAGVEP